MSTRRNIFSCLLPHRFAKLRYGDRYCVILQAGTQRPCGEPQDQWRTRYIRFSATFFVSLSAVDCPLPATVKTISTIDSRVPTGSFSSASMMRSYLRYNALSSFTAEFSTARTPRSSLIFIVSHISDSMDTLSAEAILYAVPTDGCPSPLFFPFVIVEYGTPASVASVFKLISR